MVTHKELVVGLRERYEKARRLYEEQSRLDPEDEPHASRYAARRELHALQTVLEPLPKDSFRPQLAAVLLMLGRIDLDTEELSEGENHLTACIKLLEGHERQPLTVLVALNALNQLGILWSHRESVLDSKKYLEEAELIYKDFKSQQQTPTNISDLFIDPEDVQSVDSFLNLEKTHTLTLYYLAQVYGSLEDFLKSAVYCHTTLKRQLEFSDYDPIDWALNSATLSQFFMKKNGFKQARHHLSAASYILDKYEEVLTSEESGSDAHQAKVEVFRYRSADVARCWTKYGLAVLTSSKDRLLNHADDDEDTTTCSLTSDLAKLELSEDSTVSVNDLAQLSFNSLNLSIYENQITYKFALTYDDAKMIFQTAKQWIDKATSYYTMENLASDHIQIMQDASQLYKSLAFFEDDSERQAKMHKRRIDILENVIKDLNPMYYMSFLRQIWYELAETSVEILDIKLDKMKASNDVPTPHALKKVNSLAEQSIKYFDSFLNSLKQPSSDKMPNKFTEETEKAALGAYFQIGGLYMKIIVPNKKSQLENSENTLKYYRALVDYCTIHETASNMMKIELGLCKEMIDLLPFRIQKLKRELQVTE